MIIENTPINQLIIIKPQVFKDDRGFFFESYNAKKLSDKNFNHKFIQDNVSMSNKGVLRGLHFQAKPHSQGKLVQVIKGAVLDVAVDLRLNSPTYGKHHTIELTEDNKFQFFVPEGFAHGFLTLVDNTIFSYKCTNYYHKDSEVSMLWNDKELDINWGTDNVILSEKDKNGLLFSSFKSPF